MDVCITKYSNLPDFSQLKPITTNSEEESPVQPMEQSPVVLSNSCKTETVPESIKRRVYTGNNGNGFPLTLECKITEKALNHDCYLALELGDDIDGDGDPIMQEDDQQLGDGRIAAPCMDDDPIFKECYLVKEEDGTTPLETEENTNYFLTQCI